MDYINTLRWFCIYMYIVTLFILIQIHNLFTTEEEGSSLWNVFYIYCTYIHINMNLIITSLLFNFVIKVTKKSIESSFKHDEIEVTIQPNAPKSDNNLMISQKEQLMWTAYNKTREDFFKKKHGCGFIFSKLYYTSTFLIHIFSISWNHSSMNNRHDLGLRSWIFFLKIKKFPTFSETKGGNV